MAQYSGADTAKDHVGWVPSSPGRSTLNIVWSCVSVLLVCTYKCVHLNISSFEENQAGWYKTKLFGVELSYWPKPLLVRKSFRKVKWMLIILVAPELGVGMAVDQFLAAREELRIAKDRFPEEEHILTLTHGFYSIMGGYAMADEPPLKLSDASKGQPKDSLGFTEVYSTDVALDAVEPGTLEPIDGNSLGADESYLQQKPPIEVPDEEHGGSSLSHGEEAPGESWRVNYESLQALDLKEYVQICKSLPPYPNQIATEQSISDRSKSDSFTKIFAIVQSTWLIVQSIARVSAGLPLAQLELATMAYVLCAVFMYGFWWYKPFGSEHVIIVPDPKNIFPYRGNWRRQIEVTSDQIEDMVSVGLSDSASVSFTQGMFYGVATAFAAVHLAAWNWEFSSYAVKMLWRIFGVASTAAGPCTIASSTIYYWTHLSWLKAICRYLLAGVGFV